jgi:dTDP-4-dehydrorhamnose 3,5-epimerase
VSAAIRELALPGVLEIIPVRHGDARGWFAETFREDWLATHVPGLRFVQDNASHSTRRGVLRGLHYQLAPRAQAKLVHVVRGAIFDVAVDLRAGSRSFGRWVGLELSAERMNQIFVPAGFAHGFVTLVDDTQIAYKVSDTYAPEFDRSIRYDDPRIAIDWPVPPAEIQLSAKDAAAPFLADAECFP